MSIRFCSSARHCQVALYIWKWKRLICGICIYGCTLPVDFLSGRAVSVEFSYLEVPYLWYFYIWKHLVSGICNETCVRVIIVMYFFGRSMRVWSRTGTASARRRIPSASGHPPHSQRRSNVKGNILKIRLVIQKQKHPIITYSELLSHQRNQICG